MSATPPTIEWFIARDGAQHGPISDAEMGKFVELGHLRATDLVWCARFTAWQTGAQAFPDRFQPKPAAAPPPSAPAPAAAPPPAATEAVAKPQPQKQLADNASPQPSSPATQAQQSPGSAPESRLGNEAAWAEAIRSVDAAPRPGTATPRSQELGAAAAAPQRADRAQPAPEIVLSGAAGSEMPPMNPAVHRQPVVDNDSDLLEEAETRPRRSYVGLATAALAVCLILGGLAWFAWQNRALVGGASAIGNVLAPSRSPQASTEMLRAPPYVAPGATKAEVDASLQKIAIWRFLKREFADWYQEITSEVERMRAQKQDERAVTQYLVNVIVTLRRRNAAAALQSSPDFLRGMASAFVANLKQLGSRDGSTCYAFITHGEASPFMIELSRTPAFSEALQKQMIAIFSAVVDARSGRKVHPNTRRTDYDVLTEDLTKQRGWSQQDLATFSDPQKLSNSPTDKVCSLVQDWFITQLALKDADLQTRLLAESLKPLVGG